LASSAYTVAANVRSWAAAARSASGEIRIGAAAVMRRSTADVTASRYMSPLCSRASRESHQPRALKLSLPQWPRDTATTSTGSSPEACHVRCAQSGLQQPWTCRDPRTMRRDRGERAGASHPQRPPPRPLSVRGSRSPGISAVDDHVAHYPNRSIRQHRG
jgi:hypothetical protein